jgi:hypothetical protein
MGTLASLANCSIRPMNALLMGSIKALEAKTVAQVESENWHLSYPLQRRYVPFARPGPLQ